MEKSQSLPRNHAFWVLISAVLATLSVLLLSTAPAGANTEVNVDSSGAKISVAVPAGTSPGDVNGDGTLSTGSGGGGGGQIWPYTCEWFILDIYFTLSDLTDPLEDGRGYWLQCDLTAQGAALGFSPINTFTTYFAAQVIPGVPGSESSVTLAETAVQNLVPDALEVGISPGARQITGLESYLWPDGSTASVTETAGVPVGLEAWAIATWQGTVFDMGGGVTVSCTVQVAWSPGLTSSPCSHTYLEEQGTTAISATSTWDVVWGDNALVAGPRAAGTITLVEDLVVDVVDLEAVINQ